MPSGIPITEFYTWINMLHMTLGFHNYCLWAYHRHSYRRRRTSALYPTLGRINKTPPGSLATTPASRCHDYRRKPCFRANLPIRSYSCYQPLARLLTAYILHSSSSSSLISHELLKYCHPGGVLKHTFRSRFAWLLAQIRLQHRFISFGVLGCDTV